MNQKLQQKIIQIHSEDVYKLLAENRGRFIAVSEICEKLGKSLSTVLDALVFLKMQNRASQGVNGWVAL